MTFGNRYPHPNINISWHNASNRLFTVRDYEDTDYWFVNILSNDAFFHFPINTIMDEMTLNRVQKGEVVIVVCHYSEAYHDVVDGIYVDLITSHNIPPNQILLLTNSPDIGTEIIHISNKYQLPPINAEWLVTFEWDATEYANVYSDGHPKSVLATNTLAKSNYTKKFLSFNGQPRLHRIIFMNIMHAYDLIPLGHVSYNNYVYGKRIEDLPNGEEYYNEVLRYSLANTELSDILINSKKKLCQLTSLFLDTDPSNQQSNFRLSDSQKEYYEDSYFSVVTETLCMNNLDSNAGETGVGRILSEKIFKAILNRHPFILLGIPKSLVLLRELGYKTFSPWINEAYDTELDDMNRIHMVVKEVKKLSELSDDKLAEFLIFAKEIVEHNYNNLKSKPAPKTVPIRTMPYQLYKQDALIGHVWCSSTPKLYTDSDFNKYSAYIISNIYTPPTEFNVSMIAHLREDPTSILLLVHDWSPAPTAIDWYARLIENMISAHKLNHDQIYFIIMDRLQVGPLTTALVARGINIHVTARNHLLIELTPNYSISDRPVTKLFSVFSRSSRQWRFEFYCNLIKADLLTKCIYSYMNAMPYYGNDANNEIVINADIMHKPYMEKYSEIKDTLIDWIAGMPYTIEGDISNFYSEALFDAISQSHIHIVIETLVTGPDIHVTEKTWKAISAKKPFLIYGNIGCINWLHEHGYKTFHPFINEDYDNEEDVAVREKMIINEMKRISELAPDDLKNLLDSCSAAIEHNHALFLHERTHVWPESFQRLGFFK